MSDFGEMVDVWISVIYRATCSVIISIIHQIKPKTLGIKYLQYLRSINPIQRKVGSKNAHHL